MMCLIGLALAGLLMPLGILAEVIFGMSPVLVLVGAISITVGSAWFGFTVMRSDQDIVPAKQL